MEKEIYGKGFLATKYEPFAANFLNGDISVLKDGERVILRFPNTNIFRPSFTLIYSMIMDIFPACSSDNVSISSYGLVGIEVTCQKPI